MPETINLIPQEERIQQTKTKVVKASTIAAIILLVIVAGVGGYFFYRAYTVKQELKSVNGNIESLRANITKLSDIEINARNLFKKSNTLKTIFEKRVYYSKLVKEMEASVPEGVIVESFGLSKENTVSISAAAAKYNLVQDFTNKLLEREVFTEVSLNTVSLDGGEVSFFIVVTYSEEALYED